MKRLSQPAMFVWKCYAVFLLCPIALCAGGWLFHILEDDDYQPQFSRLAVGMRKEEAMSVLQGIRITTTMRDNGSEVVAFTEPDLFLAYFYSLTFEKGVLVSKDSDL